MIRFHEVLYKYSRRQAPVLIAPEAEFEEDRSLHIVVGPNGSGKTTLCKLMCGILTARGVTTPAVPPVLFWQDLQLFPTTVRGNLDLLAIEGGRISSLLDKFGLRPFEDVQSGNLSGGERTKLALARALGTERDTIVFDEPTTSLDASFSDILGREIRDMCSKTRIVVTHSRSLFWLLASGENTRVSVLDPLKRGGGRLSRGIPIREFTEAPPTVYAARFLGFENFFTIPKGNDARGMTRLNVLGGLSERGKKIVVPMGALELANSASLDAVRVGNPRVEYRTGGQPVVRVEWIRGGGQGKLDFVVRQTGVSLGGDLYLRLTGGSRILELTEEAYDGAQKKKDQKL